jgi:ATP-dependent helicase/nuclease subunit B
MGHGRDEDEVEDKVMARRRTFLGWDRPLCGTVPTHLLAGAEAGLLDLRDTVVVVPTRQSSWRLRAALPLAAEARGIALLGPEIVTPPVLLEPPAAAGGATGLQGLLAWVAVLTACAPGEFSAFLGAHEGQSRGTGWALQVARRLQELRQELADGGLAMADVAARGTEIEELERWLAMAELERRHFVQLATWGLADPLARKLAHAARGQLPLAVRRVVVAGVPDPPRLFMTLLGAWAAAGGLVDLLVAAPEEEAAAFDEWGRPLPEAWQARPIELSATDLWLEATPEDQASRIAKAVAAGLAAAPPADAALRPCLALGVPDRETVAPLQRELAAIGLPAFDPQNRRLAETALFRLVQALLDLRRHPGYAEVAALLRHPDVLAGFGGDGATMLAELDTCQAACLPVLLADMVPRPLGKKPGQPRHLEAALGRVRQWRQVLQGADLAAALREVLQEIYAPRQLKDGDPVDTAFRQAVAAFDAALRELAGALAAGQASDHADEVLLARLQDATVKPERHREHLDLEGWLELAWNPAPLLFVAGMNEGMVPDGRVGDLFLPDTLRRLLGLRDDHLRLARDAYVLTALTRQRHGSGRVVLLVGKTAIDGDPLRPSRLLFRCPDAALVARAQALFRDPDPARASAAFSISFPLDPARVPADAINRRRSREMTPTRFKDFLACPLRFYLRHVLGMAAVDDRSREPDAMAFGSLIHAVLEVMAQDRKLWACGDGDLLGARLATLLDEQVRARYGARPWLGVELARHSATKRLQALAHRQVQWHQSGWDILTEACEQEQQLVLGGMVIRGRIDRIDRHRQDGTICVLDYKTSNKADPPEKAHLGSPRPDDDLPEAGVPADLFDGAAEEPAAPATKGTPRKAKAAATKKGKRWADLQLPLYREMVKDKLGENVNVSLGYVCLPLALGETTFHLWDSYHDALHAAAMACAEAIVQRIRNGVFWPPGKAAYDDDLGALLLDDPTKTLCAPPPPWEATP